jgi:hypothetical protein
MSSTIVQAFYRKCERFKNPLDMYPFCFDRNQCIFIHISKAAGISICISLFDYQVGQVENKYSKDIELFGY